MARLTLWPSDKLTTCWARRTRGTSASRSERLERAEDVCPAGDRAVDSIHEFEAVMIGR
jgi:hypothetical protein